jgi:hypothetical protein
MVWRLRLLDFMARGTANRETRNNMTEHGPAVFAFQIRGHAPTQRVEIEFYDDFEI